MSFEDLPDDFFQEELSGYNCEKELFSVLQMEAFNNFGVQLVYYPISYGTTYDPIFGEDNDRSVIRNFEIMGYYDLPKENKIGTVFGLDVLDQITVYVNKDHFRQASTYLLSGSGTSGFYPEYEKPKVGDLLKPTYNNFCYEIITVKDTDEMFEKYKHSWSLIAKPYYNQHLSVSATVGPSQIPGQDIPSGGSSIDIFFN